MKLKHAPSSTRDERRGKLPRLHERAPKAAVSLEDLRPHVNNYFIRTPTESQLAKLQSLHERADTRALTTTKPGRVETALLHLETFVAATARVPFLAPTTEGAKAYNQRTLELFAEHMREGGYLRAHLSHKKLRADTISGYVSALRIYAEKLAHARLTTSAHNTHLSDMYKGMRQEDAPVGGSDRQASIGMRATHIETWARGLPADFLDTCAGATELGVAVTAHNLMLRGGEVGTSDGKRFDLHRDITLGSVEFKRANAESKHLPWLVMWITSIKDVNARRVPVPLPVRRRTRQSEGDLLDPYDAIVRVWLHRCHKLTPAERGLCMGEGRAKGEGSDEPLFVLPDGKHWQTKNVLQLARTIALANNEDPGKVFARAFRIAGATDMREALGESAERVIKERGRWASDIAFIYQRALVATHLDASAAVGRARGRDIEALCQGWVQPAGLR